MVVLSVLSDDCWQARQALRGCCSWSLAWDKQPCGTGVLSAADLLQDGLPGLTECSVTHDVIIIHMRESKVAG
jgi:hypothetical protein